MREKAVPPTIEQGELWLALGGQLVAPAHDEKWHQRVELPREVIIGVFELGRFVRQDQHLLNDNWLLGKAVGSS